MAQPNVTDPSSAARKWANRVGVSGADYKAGAVAAASRWQAASAASENNYKAGVSDAMAKGRYSKGIQTAGAAAYSSGVEMKGEGRFAQGAAASEPKYTAAIGPVLNAIKAVQIPERGPKGSEANYGRATAVAKGLRQWAMAR